MERIDLLKELFDEKVIEILRVFLAHKEKQFYLREISIHSGVSLATTFRNMAKLVESGFIEETQIGKFKVYKLATGQKAKFLEEILIKEAKPLEAFLKRAEKMNRLKKVILQEQKENSAKLILIGEMLSEDEIKRICKEVKNRHNFTINYLSISNSQLKQMEEIGISKGLNKILLDRM